MAVFGRATGLVLNLGKCGVLPLGSAGAGLLAGAQVAGLRVLDAGVSLGVPVSTGLPPPEGVTGVCRERLVAAYTKLARFPMSAFGRGHAAANYGVSRILFRAVHCGMTPEAERVLSRWTAALVYRSVGPDPPAELPRWASSVPGAPAELLMGQPAHVAVVLAALPTAWVEAAAGGAALTVLRPLRQFSPLPQEGERAAVVEILRLVGWQLPGIITPAGWRRGRPGLRSTAARPAPQPAAAGGGAAGKPQWVGFAHGPGVVGKLTCKLAVALQLRAVVDERRVRRAATVEAALALDHGPHGGPRATDAQVCAGLRGLEAAVPALWRVPLLNARKEPIWRLWLVTMGDLAGGRRALPLRLPLWLAAVVLASACDTARASSVAGRALLQQNSDFPERSPNCGYATACDSMAGWTQATGGNFYFCETGSQQGQCQAYLDGPFADATCTKQCSVLPASIAPCDFTYSCPTGAYYYYCIAGPSDTGKCSTRPYGPSGCTNLCYVTPRTTDSNQPTNPAPPPPPSPGARSPPPRRHLAAAAAPPPAAVAAPADRNPARAAARIAAAAAPADADAVADTHADADASGDCARVHDDRTVLQRSGNVLACTTIVPCSNDRPYYCQAGPNFNGCSPNMWPPGSCSRQCFYNSGTPTPTPTAAPILVCGFVTPCPVGNFFYCSVSGISECRPIAQGVAGWACDPICLSSK
ncbi:hypothetical protein FOA52_009161 [Chlamydomonas sp. UWO 241]|nr:hypothetical protein FOA52_009161 [Chlamydomonas sp. UWO 241]